jgi:hypothetical protein
MQQLSNDFRIYVTIWRWRTFNNVSRTVRLMSFWYFIQVELVFSVLLVTEQPQLNKASYTSHSPNRYAAMISKQHGHFRTHFTHIWRNTEQFRVMSTRCINRYSMTQNGEPG